MSKNRLSITMSASSLLLSLVVLLSMAHHVTDTVALVLAGVLGGLTLVTALILYRHATGK